MKQLLITLGTDVQTLLYAGLMIAVTLVVLLILVRLINSLFKKLNLRFEENGISTSLLTVIKYALLVIIYVAAFFGVVSQIPLLNKFLSTLLTGSGIVALVVSVAAQEPISNLVSGIIISITKPFAVGDLIRYVDKDISGIVEAITLRHTLIRTFENKRLVIPNSIINSCVIENTNYGDNRRICLLLDFSVTHESDAERAMSIIAEVIRRRPAYLDVRSDADKAAGAPDVRVFVMNLTESAVVIRAWCWVEDVALSVAARSEVLLAIQHRFRKEGIHIASPRMEIVTH